MKQFYICATPIGNLSDVSTGLINTLKKVDLIYCEDTRRTSLFLNTLNIKKELRSFFLGNEHLKAEEILKEIKNGKKIALISDAGTPLISDPGTELIRLLIKENVEITSIPGPSSVIVSLTLSGFDTNNFQFLGFIPKSKSERLEFLNKIFNNQMTTVCFTSPNRLIKDLEFFEDNNLTSEISICRELTKKFETIYRGTAKNLLKELTDINLRGEITLVISNSYLKPVLNVNLEKAIEKLIKNNIPKKEIAKIVSLLTDYSVNEIYKIIKDF